MPTIMYTGVRLRSNQECGPLPPPECDLQLPFIESQLLARALDPADPDLQRWVKQDVPFLALPPPNLPLTGWRDPFVIQRGGNGKDWIILMGAGLKDQGGTTLIYRSKRLDTPWEYSGLLCLGELSQGNMWECPLLWRIAAAPDPGGGDDPGGGGGGGTPPRFGGGAGGGGGAALSSMSAVYRGLNAASTALPGSMTAVANGTDIFGHVSHELQTAVSDGTMQAPTVNEDFGYFYCISPDAPTNPVIFWMGHFDPVTVKFRLDGASGPFRLDLGDTIYAPNILEDAQGRCVLWAWVQEHRTVGSYDFSGCMATPRILLQRDNRLVQQPLPELIELRCQGMQSWPPTSLPANSRVPIDGLNGQAFDIELVLHRGSSFVAGLMLQSWNAGAGSAAILYDFDNSLLEVVFEGLDPETKAWSMSAPGTRRIGGRIEPAHPDTIAIRVLLDHSLLEVFTGSGQCITTRVYRGAPPQPNECGLDFVAFGGSAELSVMNAWELAPIWDSKLATKLSKSADVSGMNRMMERLDIAQPQPAPVEADPPSPQSPNNPLVMDPQVVGAAPAGPNDLLAEDPQTEQPVAVQV